MDIDRNVLFLLNGLRFYTAICCAIRASAPLNHPTALPFYLCAICREIRASAPLDCKGLTIKVGIGLGWDSNL